MSKKEIRRNFRQSVFERDKFTCVVCDYHTMDETFFDAHHITDRNEMPNGGYVKENGITVCNKSTDGGDSCHILCEKYHISGGLEWNYGLHPDDLYNKIHSSKKLAIDKSERII